jgi:predicted nucleotidyltransferase
MNLRQTAHGMAQHLRKEIGAEQVWLFGSQARGDAGVDSDLDMLAVVPHSSLSRYHRAVTARRALSRFNVPMDIVVLTREEWDREIKAPSSLSSTVVREGIAL